MHVLPQAVEHSLEHTCRGDVHCLAPVPLDPVEHINASEHRARGITRWFALAPLGFAKHCPAHTALDDDVVHSLFRALRRSGHAVDLVAAHWYSPVFLVFVESFFEHNTRDDARLFVHDLLKTVRCAPEVNVHALSLQPQAFCEAIQQQKRRKVVRQTKAIAFEAFQVY